MQDEAWGRLSRRSTWLWLGVAVWTIASTSLCPTSLAEETDAQPVPAWYGRGIEAGLLDPSPGVSAATLTLPRAYNALAQIAGADPAARETIIRALKVQLDDPNATIVTFRVAASALSDMTQRDSKTREEIIRILIGHLQDGEENVRAAAAGALGQIKPNDSALLGEVTHALTARLKDPSRVVERFAILALGKVGEDDPEVTTALLDCIHRSTDFFLL